MKRPHWANDVWDFCYAFLWIAAAMVILGACLYRVISLAGFFRTP